MGFADRIKVANQLTLNEIIPDYPGGSHVITMALNSGRGWRRMRAEGCDVEGTPPPLAGSADGRGGL